MNNIKDQITRIIQEQLGVEKNEVTDNASIINDLGADSLDQVELIMAIEEDFGIEIPDEVAENLDRVKQLIECVEVHLSHDEPVSFEEVIKIEKNKPITIFNVHDENGINIKITTHSKSKMYYNDVYDAIDRCIEELKEHQELISIGEEQ